MEFTKLESYHMSRIVKGIRGHCSAIQHCLRSAVIINRYRTVPYSIINYGHSSAYQFDTRSVLQNGYNLTRHGSALTMPLNRFM